MKFTIYQETRIGKRKNNEDRLAHCYSRDALLMVVADGMGGHYYGEVAAQIAVQTFVECFQREANPSITDPFSFLQRTMHNAHCAILDYVDDHKLADSPRTTCVACLVQDDVAYWAHAGDSRLYLMRDGKMVAETRDHSRVQLLLDQGLISPAQAANHPERNKVYSCLGGPLLPEIDISRKTPLEFGDVILLCTDGLWGVTPKATLLKAYRFNDPVKITPMLLDENEKLGGATADNFTLIVARWESTFTELQNPESSAISTQSMPLDSVATHLDEFGKNRGSKMELSEDEIEKAISEIRATIQKYSK